MNMKKEYEIVKRNDDNYAVVEYRYMEQSINTKQVFVHEKRKECVEYLNKLKKVGKKNGIRKFINTSR
jgi:hypothetical protein